MKTEQLGVSIIEGRTRFAVYAPRATQITLCLFISSRIQPDAEIPLEGPDEGIWRIEIPDIPHHASYVYRMNGNMLLSDPYARAFTSFYSWGDFTNQRIPFLCRVAPLPSFDWQGVKSPKIPLSDLIIYEMHVRGFTAHPSSNIQEKGTYAGVVKKIEYLKQLGINAVELMPIYEFDETHAPKVYSAIKEQRINYWGYNPISFFIPVSRYAVRQEDAINEFKTMVRELHRAGIEVILDVVYNHTGEGNEFPVSLRGLDKTEYFMIEENGHDFNYTGCGNTFQTNSKMGQRIIVDSLRYWVEEMHIDGFRFDLASILTRNTNGHPLSDPPVLKAIEQDEILKNAKLIAEPWDAAGLNQVGQFHKWGHWSEWNSSFRDHVRNFIKGTDNETGYFASSLMGSQFTYPSGNPQSGINFITAHDGFCLRDLVTYQNKHNIENGENNRDGCDHNESWNCGAEGPTQNIEIHDLRERQLRNFWLTLLLSQGIPMILMGDEIGHTRKGNNNPYVQDNEINWFDWTILEQNQPMFHFVSSLIQFRKRHPVLRKTHFLKDDEITWHGHSPNHPDWKTRSRFIAFTLNDQQPLYIAFNTDFYPAQVYLPSLPENQNWRLVVNTIDPLDRHNFVAPEKGPILGLSIPMAPHSALVAKAVLI
jgi:isoamylase